MNEPRYKYLSSNKYDYMKMLNGLAREGWRVKQMSERGGIGNEIYYLFERDAK